MSLLARNIKWMMIVSGVLTCTMAYAVISPQSALRSTFGEELSGPVADIVVRNWGVLITLMGAMLIYGACRPAVRPLALMVAGTSKLIFVTLVLAHGGRYLGTAGIAIGIDALWVVIFTLYLLENRASAHDPA